LPSALLSPEFLKIYCSAVKTLKQHNNIAKKIRLSGILSSRKWEFYIIGSGI